MKTITKIFAAIALALPFVNAEAEDYGFGDMGGVFNVSESGAATYTLPFDLPEGINGMVPSLGLVYNSQSGNGVAGMGVSIYGTSVITRTVKDIYHDGTAKGISYTDNDVYSLDGVRLIQKTGGSDFRPENSPLDTVTTSGTGIRQNFKVALQNGNTAYYNVKAAAVEPYIWYLSKIEDPYGNVINYSYTTFDSHTIYLSSVSYGMETTTGRTNTITFEYEERPDKINYIVNGCKRIMSRRLKSVTIKTNNVERNKYTLTYSNNDAFSRLTKVEESYGTTKLPPVKLFWNYFNTSITNNSIPVEFFDVTMEKFRNDMILLSGDVRGFGKSDLIVLDTRFSDISLYTKDPSGDFFAGPCTYPFPEDVDLMMNTAIKGTYIADYDGDGKNEIILPYMKGDDYGFFIKNTDSNILYSKSWPLNYQCEPIHTIGNFYNNGRSQILFLETIGWQKGHFDKNQPSKYYGGIIMKTDTESEKNIPFSLILPSTPKNIFASDYNGDGLCDIIVIQENGYTIFWNQGVTEGAVPFSDDKKQSFDNLKYAIMIQTGDFNGDGLADFLTNCTDEDDWHFYLNDGYGFFTHKIACTMDVHDHNFTDKDNKRFSCHVLDFNHDGKDDVVITKAKYQRRNILGDKFQKTYTYWMKSDGSALTNVKTASSNSDGDALNGCFTTGDFDGDGIIEFMNYGYDCYGETDTKAKFRIYNTTGISANTNKVSKISIGDVGITTNITYSTLADADIYIKGSGNYYPLVDLQIPLNVVKEETKHIAYNTYTTNYKYRGLRAHLLGKGGLGFTTIEVENNTTGELRKTTVNSLNETYYEPSEVTNTISQNGKTATTVTTFSVKTKSGYKNCHFTYPKTVNETGFYGEVVTTTNSYDSKFRLTQQHTVYDNNANMYRQINYSSFINAGRTSKPQTVETKQKHKDDKNIFSSKTTYKYDSKTGAVTEMIENSTKPVTHTYTYSSFGNMETHTVSASGITPVTTTYSYEVTNRFADTVSSSANGLITIYVYNDLGRMTKKQEGLKSSLQTTNYSYDAVGNISTIKYPDGTSTTYTRSWGTMPYRSYSVTTKTTGQAATTTWYDNLDREVETTSTGEKGVSLTSTKSYNTATGQLYSHNNKIGGLTISETRGYNKLGQLTSVSSNSGKKITYSYSARSVTSTQSGINYILQKNFDAWGNTTYVSANGCTSTTYKYSSNGQPISVRYGDASYQDYMASTMTYDSRGLQTSLTDIDAGKTSYEYDALGRVTKQTDARGNITTNTYNASGLLTKQVCGDVTTTYEYDSRLRLTKETAGSQSISYTYDTYNRLTKKSYSIDGTVLSFSYTYNSNGQMATQTFPDGMTENYTYDANGYLAAIKIGGQRVWERDSYTGTQRRWALGTQPLYVTRKYSDKGLLTEQEIIRQAGSLHKMTYSFDGATGNLTQRTGMNGTETFKYDQFDRLNTGTSYALNGNIASKTGIGKYTYDTGKKNAVVQVENTDNLIQGAASLTYNAFNKVATVVQGTNTLTITYGPDRQRTKTVLVNGSNTTTTLYADNYEQRTANGVTTTYHYVASPDGLAAVYVKSGSTATAYYIETDHLGSIIRAYDYIGNTKFSAAYDAWGNQTVGTNAIGLTRGYTGHEHWPQFSLIDMNGRFYDPLLGRFLSPDPYVQAPENPQNYNRYAYCLNNPLKYTDPSGEFWHIVIGAAIGGVVNWATHGCDFTWEGLGYFGIGALAGGASAAIGGGMSSALAGGSFWAGAGGTSAAMTVTSSCWSGAAIGAVSGAIGGTISEAGNAWMGGASFGQGVWKGFIGGNIGGLTGGILGGIGGGIDAVSDGRDFWTGHEWETIADYRLPNGNLPLHHQTNSEVGCTQETLESFAEYYDKPIEITNKTIGMDLAESAKNNGFTAQRISPSEFSVGKELSQNHCVGITYNNFGTEHTVGINEIKIQRCIRFSGNYKTRSIIKVMDPLLKNRYGTITAKQLHNSVVRVVF